jgi:ParB family chromosome partitioning protein
MHRDVREIELKKISPNHRLVCSDESIEVLAQSIRLRGQLEPVEIFFMGASFRIMDGEKRWRACRRLGMTRIKAVIVAS